MWADGSIVVLNCPDVCTRSKGLTEIDLVSLGYDDVIIFRPGFLAQAERLGTARLEHTVA